MAEFRARLSSRLLSPAWLAILTPLGAFAAALLVGALMLALLWVSPSAAYGAMFEGAFGSANSIADTLVKATPLLLVAVGICIAFRGGMLNIGGEGQLIVGGLAATAAILRIPDLPSWALIPLGLGLGFLAGAAWGAVPGLLKARLQVNEILTTIMMNAIAVQALNYLLRGPLMDPEQVLAGSFIPQTARFTVAADLPRLVPTRLHAGFLLAILMAILAWVLLWRTTIGFRIRAVGLNPFASRRAGIRVSRYSVMAMVLSGALCGLAGAVQVMGVNHRMFTDGSSAGFTGSAGFNGIVAALFGQLHPLGSIPASIFFGGLIVGGAMQRAAQIPRRHSQRSTVFGDLRVSGDICAAVWCSDAEGGGGPSAGHGRRQSAMIEDL
jgi:simple sugar transport system permease protein